MITDEEAATGGEQSNSPLDPVAISLNATAPSPKGTDILPRESSIVLLSGRLASDPNRQGH